MPTTPDIGFNDAPSYFWHKAYPAYDRFTKQLTRANGIEFASAAWHLCERLWHAQGKPGTKKQFIETLFSACPELAWMQDIAEAEKHHELGRPTVRVAKIVGAESYGGTLHASSFGFQTYSGPPPCTLEIKLDDETRHPLPDVLKRVFNFLRSRVD